MMMGIQQRCWCSIGGAGGGGLRNVDFSIEATII